MLGLFLSKLGHNIYMDRLLIVHVSDGTPGHQIGIVAGYYEILHMRIPSLILYM